MGLSFLKVMRCFAWIAFGVVVTTAFSQGAGTTPNRRSKTAVDVKYDKSSDTTSVRLASMTVIQNLGGNEQELLELSVSFSYPKQVIATPKTVTIFVYSLYAGGAGFEDNRRLIVTLDGVQTDLGNMDLVVDKSLSLRNDSIPWVQQNVRLSIQSTDFFRMAKAKQVKVVVGRKKFAFSEKQIQSLRDFADLMQQEGQPFGP